jgi:hypothetical protein
MAALVTSRRFPIFQFVGGKFKSAHENLKQCGAGYWLLVIGYYIGRRLDFQLLLNLKTKTRRKTFSIVKGPSDLASFNSKPKSSAQRRTTGLKQ